MNPDMQGAHLLSRVRSLRCSQMMRAMGCSLASSSRTCHDRKDRLYAVRGSDSIVRGQLQQDLQGVVTPVLFTCMQCLHNVVQCTCTYHSGLQKPCKHVYTNQTRRPPTSWPVEKPPPLRSRALGGGGMLSTSNSTWLTCTDKQMNWGVGSTADQLPRQQRGLTRRLAICASCMLPGHARRPIRQLPVNSTNTSSPLQAHLLWRPQVELAAGGLVCERLELLDAPLQLRLLCRSIMVQMASMVPSQSHAAFICPARSPASPSLPTST